MGAPLPPGTTSDNLDRPLSVPVAPTGVTALGPAIIVDGCLRAAGKGEDEVFTLKSTDRAQSLSEAQPPQDLKNYRVIGSDPDLKRHVDQHVEVIGVIQDATEPKGPTPLTLDMKSVRSTDEKCSE